MKLIVGLGNPGSQYAANRHNVGYMCINHLARASGIKFDRKQGLARVGLGKIAGREVVLAKPQTYMNVSGEAVALLVKKHKAALDDLIVIHDDMDLPPGKLRLGFNSRSGGHKGIKSIIGLLGSQEFYRVRIGIGHPGESGGDDVIDFVLGDLMGEERKAIENVLPEASEAIACLISEGLDAAMNKFN
jgi:peptidyl-tRNA hydrolase, PTH1 family